MPRRPSRSREGDRQKQNRVCCIYIDGVKHRFIYRSSLGRKSPYIYVKGVKYQVVRDKDFGVIGYDLAPSESLDAQLYYWETQARTQQGHDALDLLHYIFELRGLVGDDEQRAEAVYKALWTGKLHSRTSESLPPEARRAVTAWLNSQVGTRRRAQEYRTRQLVPVEHHIGRRSRQLLEQGYSFRVVAKQLHETWDLELNEPSRYRDGRPSVEMIRKLIARISPLPQRK